MPQLPVFLIIVLLSRVGPATPPVHEELFWGRKSPAKSRIERAIPEEFRKTFLQWMSREEIAMMKYKRKTPDNSI